VTALLVTSVKKVQLQRLKLVVTTITTVLPVPFRWSLALLAITPLPLVKLLATIAQMEKPAEEPPHRLTVLTVTTALTIHQLHALPARTWPHFQVNQQMQIVMLAPQDTVAEYPTLEWTAQPVSTARAAPSLQGLTNPLLKVVVCADPVTIARPPRYPKLPALQVTIAPISLQIYKLHAHLVITVPRQEP
jgi:hypothetical protein